MIFMVFGAFLVCGMEIKIKYLFDVFCIQTTSLKNLKHFLRLFKARQEI